MLETLSALNALSPLGVIALLALVIYLLVQQRALATNHLHEMPEIVPLLREMNRKQDETIKLLVHIKARVNGSD